MRDDRRAVVTGLGVVSPIAVGVEPFWKEIQAGTSGSRPVRSFDTTALRNHLGCEVEDAWLPAPPPPDAEGRRPTRAVRLATVAAREALAGAAVDPETIDLVCLGTTMGELPDLEAVLGEPASPAASAEVSAKLCGSFAARVAAAVGVEAPAFTVATSCSAGNIALCRALDLIRGGHAERALAGGADAFSRLAFIGFSRMRGMSPDVCRPFSFGRKGMLLAEGAAFLVLESLASARARGARVLAEFLGYGLSCDAYHVATPAPHGRGAVAAMERALAASGVAPGEVDYVCAHGTGTAQNDSAESAACRTVFGGHRPWISSLKALLGHAMGAASALEAAACVLALRDQRLVPAWNVEGPDPECDVRLPLPAAIDGGGAELRTVVSNAFAFGGNNSCIVLRRATP